MLPAGQLLLLMLLEGVARRPDQGDLPFAFAFALRLQRVDGRRFDAFVADLHCSRVHRGAAPIVSYVSATLIRVCVNECAYLLVCVRAGACARAHHACCCVHLRFQVSDCRYL